MKSGVGGGGTFEWVDSVLVRALQDGHWLLIDNVNFCSASVLDRLNALLEPNGVLSVNERGTVDDVTVQIVPHPDFRLFFAMDPKHGELSRAMRNRGIEICLLGEDDDCSASKDDIVSMLHSLGLNSSKLINWLLALHSAMRSELPFGEKPIIADLLHAGSLLTQLLQKGFSVTESSKHVVQDVYVSATKYSATKKIAKDMALKFLSLFQLAKELTLKLMPLFQIAKDMALKFMSFFQIAKELALKLMPVFQIAKDMALKFMSFFQIAKELALKFLSDLTDDQNEDQSLLPVLKMSIMNDVSWLSQIKLASLPLLSVLQDIGESRPVKLEAAATIFVRLQSSESWQLALDWLNIMSVENKKDDGSLVQKCTNRVRQLVSVCLPCIFDSRIWKDLHKQLKEIFASSSEGLLLFYWPLSLHVQCWDLNMNPQSCQRALVLLGPKDSTTQQQLNAVMLHVQRLDMLLYCLHVAFNLKEKVEQLDQSKVFWTRTDRRHCPDWVYNIVVCMCSSVLDTYRQTADIALTDWVYNIVVCMCSSVLDTYRQTTRP
ncbi:AAA ATPase midasin [Bulinus truncatus]|nr:AAA ATPase midasin [Bulinus truncatus]